MSFRTVPGGDESFEFKLRIALFHVNSPIHPFLALLHVDSYAVRDSQGVPVVCQGLGFDLLWRLLPGNWAQVAHVGTGVESHQPPVGVGRCLHCAAVGRSSQPALMVVPRPSMKTSAPAAGTLPARPAPPATTVKQRQ